MGSEETAHMCELAGKKERWEELKKSAAGARWICSACGRSAAEKDRLCVPEALEDGADAAQDSGGQGR